MEPSTDPAHTALLVMDVEPAAMHPLHGSASATDAVPLLPSPPRAATAVWRLHPDGVRCHCWPAYPMSKAALNMLTGQIRAGLSALVVNSATPGLTATEFAPAAKGGHPS
jgi:NAD(P)-dependent dehydrogenase (short-subunit alcohol dehydrogenase family)